MQEVLLVMVDAMVCMVRVQGAPILVPKQRDEKGWEGGGEGVGRSTVKGGEGNEMRRLSQDIVFLRIECLLFILSVLPVLRSVLVHLNGKRKASPWGGTLGTRNTHALSQGTFTASKGKKKVQKGIV